jgi:hypothetical protein
VGLVLAFGCHRPAPPVQSASPAPAARTFFVRSRQTAFSLTADNRCLDFTSPPVVIASCTHTLAQRVGVQEINARHEVLLRAGDKVIGIHNPQVNTGAAPAAAAPVEYALELQVPANRIDPAYRNQVFALDGDSILLAADHSLVAQVKNGRGAIGTPIVVAARNLADSELWSFEATDGTDQDPTSGFIRVSNLATLLTAITQVNQVAHDNNGAAFGAVIRIIDTGTPIGFFNPPDGFCTPTAPFQCRFDDVNQRTVVHNLLIPSGVTVRGDRGPLRSGALLVGDYGCKVDGGDFVCQYEDIFQILSAQVPGDHVRVTGLRLQGPSQCVLHPDSCISPNLASVVGITVGSRNDGAPTDVIVDHNELLDWPEAGVNVVNKFDPADACPPDQGQLPVATVARNFIHHNENNDGYGVALYGGGVARIQANTFLMNRHAISVGIGEGHTRYDAESNLVLSRAPVYGGNIEQDFDVHGTDGDNDWYGGTGGGPVQIVGNTFLGADHYSRYNFELRAPPCGAGGKTVFDQFAFNVTMDVWPVHMCTAKGDDHCTLGAVNGQLNGNGIDWVAFAVDHWLERNPADRLGVGDFDGDGSEDLFLATGAAWYYASAGRAEWRFLNNRPDRVDGLLFGDFDADGRTDVFTVSGRDWLVSWGGVSPWEKLRTSEVDAPIGDLAVGQFDGDPRADIFYADGKTWQLSSGGVASFRPLDVSSFRVRDLRFGDFNRDGRTDVFGVTSGRWQFEDGGAKNWQPLPVTLTSSVAGLIVADLDGDGFADDIGRLFCSPFCVWQVSLHAATARWKSFRLVNGGHFAAVGRFQGGRKADVLEWNGDFLTIQDGTTVDPHPYSSHEMR